MGFFSSHKMFAHIRWCLSELHHREVLDEKVCILASLTLLSHWRPVALNFIDYTSASIYPFKLTLQCWRLRIRSFHVCLQCHVILAHTLAHCLGSCLAHIAGCLVIHVSMATYKKLEIGIVNKVDTLPSLVFPNAMECKRRNMPREEEERGQEGKQAVCGDHTST